MEMTSIDGKWNASIVLIFLTGISLWSGASVASIVTQKCPLFKWFECWRINCFTVIIKCRLTSNCQKSWFSLHENPQRMTIYFTRQKCRYENCLLYSTRPIRYNVLRDIMSWLIHWPTNERIMPHSVKECSCRDIEKCFLDIQPKWDKSFVRDLHFDLIEKKITISARIHQSSFPIGAHSPRTLTRMQLTQAKC